METVAPYGAWIESIKQINKQIDKQPKNERIENILLKEDHFLDLLGGRFATFIDPENESPKNTGKGKLLKKMPLEEGSQARKKKKKNKVINY